MRIPKIIHYCWFGNDEKPKLVEDCISSWKLFLPDYKIIEWNERNTDLSHPLLQKVYRLRKWAFVSDFVRLNVLYDFGGLYLDTDMLVLKPLDNFLKNDCFFGAEDERFINASILGAVKNHDFINQCRLEYQNMRINNLTNWQLISIPRIITELYRNSFEFNKPFNEIIEKNDVVIYPPSYFYPLRNKDKADYINYKKYISSNSYAVHLWNASWVQPNEFYYLRRREYIKGLAKVGANIRANRHLSWTYLKKILSSLKESINLKKTEND